MRTTFDRHAERLTAGERRMIWERVAGARRAGPARAWRLAPALGTAVAVAFALVLWQRGPTDVRPLAPSMSRGAHVPVPAEPDREEAESRAKAAGGASGLTPPPVVARRPAEHGASGPAARDRAAEPVAVVLPEPAAVPPAAAASAPVAFGRVTGRVMGPSGPEAYANVIIAGTKQGAMTDEQGRFAIPGVPVGTVQVQVMATGFDRQLREVQVEDGCATEVEVRLGPQQLVKQFDVIEVSGTRAGETRTSTTRQSISAEQLRSLPVDNLRDAVAKKGGVVAQGGELHFRGGRAGETKFQFDGVQVTDPLAGRAGISMAPSTVAQPPVVPTTGGTRLPNDEAFDSMFFREHGVNPFVATDEDPFSTFAVDVDAGSYTLARRYLELGHLPPAAAVRVEEFVNFFPQGYPRSEREDFRILMDGAPSAFGPGLQLVRIGIQGRDVPVDQRKPAALTFVVDVSGSMAREDRLELVKRALTLLVDQLRDDDRVGLVVYGTQGRVVLEPTALGQDDAERVLRPRWRVPGTTGVEARRAELLAAIGSLHPEGATNAEEGLRLGYDMARRAFREGGINRIVLCSDGVANVGITGPEAILARVRGEAARGVSLTTIGFGMGNYNDALMERLADQGDGNHYYVDDLDEARRVLVENLTGTLQTIGKDAKIQVEFDSTRVVRWRLLGFENRDVADRDFRNDRVDAGEIGAGHTVTALYEIKLARGVAPGPLATVRFRWASPEHEGAGAPRVREIERTLASGALAPRFESASPRLRLDAAVAEFAELLRGSYWAREGRLTDALAVARAAARELGEPAGHELVTLIEKAAELRKRGLGPGQ